MSTDQCLEYTYYKQIATVPMEQLTLSDLMLLTGHSNCCRVRLKKEKEGASN